MFADLVAETSFTGDQSQPPVDNGAANTSLMDLGAEMNAPIASNQNLDNSLIGLDGGNMMMSSVNVDNNMNRSLIGLDSGMQGGPDHNDMNTSLMDLNGAMQPGEGQDIIDEMGQNPNDLSAIQFGDHNQDALVTNTSIIDPALMTEEQDL